MRIIIARFEVPDNDLAEYNLFKELDSLGCKDFTKLPDTKKYYDTDENFRKLAKERKKANKNYNNYINRLKLKK